MSRNKKKTEKASKAAATTEKEIKAPATAAKETVKADKKAINPVVSLRSKLHKKPENKLAKQKNINEINTPKLSAEKSNSAAIFFKKLKQIWMKPHPKQVKTKQKPLKETNYSDSQNGKIFWHNVRHRIFAENTVFLKAIAVAPILGAAVSLKNGVMLSCVMFLTVVFLNLVMYPLNKIVPHRFSAVCAFFMAGIIITPLYYAAQYCAPSIAALCGIYLPLLSVCALPMIETKHYGEKYGFAKTMLAAILDGFGFAFAALLFSIVREAVGSGTLYDRALPGFAQMKFSFALLPAGAFLLLGLFVALFRKICGRQENREDSK